MATIAAIPQVVNAAQTLPFLPRFSTNANGALVAIGNTLMTCPDTDPNCALAKTGKAPNNNNNAYNMINLDLDTDPSTFNSSMADLDLPAGDGVLWAGLYWGARLKAGTNGVAGTGDYNTMALKVPGGSAYIPIQASSDPGALFGPLTSGSDAYQRFADVTTIVQQAGTGDYWGANVVGGTGQDRYAGWSLVVVFSAPGMPLRNLTVFDGFNNVGNNSPQTITVSGFLTPVSGQVNAQLAMVAYEGDLSQTGDRTTLNNTQLATAVSPGSNFFNSTNDYYGQIVTSGNPADRNLLGYDIKNLGTSGVIPNGATSATFAFSSTGDAYYPGVLGIGIDLYAPDFSTSAKTVVDLSGNSPAQPGDILQYTVRYANTGQDPATKLTSTDPIPAGTEYVPGSLRMVDPFGMTVTPLTDASLDDQGEFTGSAVRVRIGTGASSSTGGNLTVGGDSQGYAFQVRVLPSAAGTVIANMAHLGYMTATTGVGSTYDVAPVETEVAEWADVSITKTMSPRVDVAGSPVTATLTVTNNGPNTATGVRVVDPIIDGFTGVTWDLSGAADGGTCEIQTPAGSGDQLVCSLPDLLDQDTMVILVSGTMPPDSTLTTMTDVASVSTTVFDPDMTNNVSSDTIQIVQQADLSITKTADQTAVTPGTSVTYTLTATNNGPSDAVGVQIADQVAPDSTDALSLTSMTPGGASLTCTQASTTGGTCVIARLRPGESATVVVAGVLGPDATQGATITNSATVSSGTVDPDLSNNTADATITVAPPSADVRLDKEVSPATLTAGGPVTYTLTATNYGPSNADGVTISDTLPATVTGIQATTDRGTCAVTGQEVDCAIGVLPASTISGSPGATATVTITGTVDPGATGTISNTASVSATTDDPDLTSNTATADAPVQGVADISVTKTADRSRLPLVGTPVTYTIRIHNNGPSVARDVTLEDQIPAGLVMDAATPPDGLPAGATCDPSFSPTSDPDHTLWTCALGDIGVGVSNDVVIDLYTVSTVNAASAMTETVTVASPTEPSSLTGDDTASWTMDAGALADLSIAKTVDQATLRAGGTAVYTLTVANAGPDDSTATVTDTLPPGVSLIPAGPGSQTSSGCAADATDPQSVSCVPTLIPDGGADLVLTLEVQIAPDLSTGDTLSNTAEVTGSTTDPSLANNQTTLTTPVVAQTNIEVTDVTWQPYQGMNQPPANQSITSAPAASFVWLTMTITNTGPATAQNTSLLLNDDLPMSGVTANNTDPVLIWWNSSSAWVTTGTGCQIVQDDLACALDNGAKGSTLDPGDSVTVSVLMMVHNSALPTSGSAIVQAQTTTYEPDLTDNTKEAPLAITAGEAGLSILKTAQPGDGDNGALIAGTSFVYSVQVWQDPRDVQYTQGLSWADARDVVVTDQLPAGFHATNVSTSQGTCAIDTTDDSQFSCAIGTIPGVWGTVPGNRVTVIVRGRTDSDVSGADIPNTAYASTSTNPGEEVSSSVDVAVDSESDLRLFKMVDPGSSQASDLTPVFYVGGQVGYTLTVVNLGPSDSGASTITDTLPQGLTLNTASSPGCQVVPPAPAAPASPQVVTCSVPPLTFGQAQVVRVVAMSSAMDDRQAGTGPGCVPGDPSLPWDPTSAPNPPGCDQYPTYPRQIVNQATVAPDAASQVDPNLANNAATASAWLDAQMDVSISTYVNTPNPVAGGTVTFGAFSSNAGPSIANFPFADATFPPGFVPISTDVPGNICTWTTSGTPVQYSLHCESIPATPWYMVFLPGQSAVSSVTMSIPDDASGTYTATVGTHSSTDQAHSPGTVDVGDINLANNVSSVSVTVQRSSDLSVTKTLLSPDPLVAGQPVSYEVSVSNAGPSIADDVLVSDTQPDGMTFQPGSSSSTCSAVEQTEGSPVVECGLGTLGVGDSATATVSFLVDAGVTADSMCNTAVVGSGSQDPDASNNVSETCDPVVPPPLADLSVAVSPATASVYPDGEFAMVGTVVNNGPGPATGVALTWQIPSGVTVSALQLRSASTGLTPDSTCTVTGTTATCLIGALPVGDTVSYDLTGTAAGPAGSTYTVTASVTQDRTDPDTTNDQASAQVDVVAVPTPALNVSKSVVPATGAVSPGDAVSYTVSIVNSGTAAGAVDEVDDLTGVLDDATMVAMTTSPGVTAQLVGGHLLITGSVDAGQTATVTYAVTVNPDGQRGDSVLFNAVAAGDTPAADRPTIDTPASQCGPCTWTPVAALDLVKTAQPTSVGLAGDQITYQFAVTNTGGTSVDGLAVQDSLGTRAGAMSAITCGTTTLAPGERTICWSTYTVAASDLTGAQIENTATATGLAGSQTITSNPSTADVGVRAATDVGVSFAPTQSQVYPGGQAAFTATVTNNGPGAATGVQMTVTIPAGMSDVVGTLSSADTGVAAAPSCVLTGSQLTCVVGDLGPGQSASFGITGAAAGPAGTTYTLTGVVTHGEADTDPGNDQADHVVTVVAAPVPALIMAKSVSPTDPVVTAGTLLTYTITLTNIGPAPAVVNHVDDLSGVVDDADLVSVSADPGLDAGVYGGDNLAITGTVDPGQSGRVTYTVRVKANGERGDSVLFNAVSSGDTPPGERPTIDTPTSQCPTCVTTRVAGLALAKTASPTVATLAGQVVTYRFLVTNDGSVPVGDVGISDTDFSGAGTLSAPVCESTQLDPGASTTCAATYAVQLHDFLDDWLTNQATASGMALGVPVVSDPSSAQVALTQATDVGVSITPDSRQVYPGGQVGFTATLTNNGPMDATAVQMAWQVPGGLSNVSATLSGSTDGLTREVSCSMTGATMVCQVDGLGVGESVSYDLIARVTGPAGTTYAIQGVSTHGEADTDPSNDQAQATIEVVPVPVPLVTIAKAVSPADSVVLAGTELAYTITLTNPGIVPAVIDHVDDLSALLDDATLGPITASTGLTTQVVGQDMMISGVIDPGQSATVSYTATVLPDGQRGDSVVFNSVFPADTPDQGRPGLGSTCAGCVTTDVAGLMMTKSVSPTTAGAVGEQVSYQYEVTNVGSVAVGDLAIVETAFSGSGALQDASCVVGSVVSGQSLAPGESTMCTALYTVTDADMTAGFVDNTAVVSGSVSVVLGTGQPSVLDVTSDPSSARLTVTSTPTTPPTSPPTTPPTSPPTSPPTTPPTSPPTTPPTSPPTSPPTTPPTSPPTTPPTSPPT
ncbi:MAG: hypothetical protein FWD75_10320, partial [Propionibacteriaceae bacterium]|nr:hypothetical protein [Propionibacteriaceae bacterium]